MTRDGRAGSVSTTNATDPEWLACDEVIELAAGRSHVCVRQRDGAVTCWGDNDVGQLGAPPGSAVRNPVTIDFGNARE